MKKIFLLTAAIALCLSAFAQNSDMKTKDEGKKEVKRTMVMTPGPVMPKHCMQEDGDCCGIPGLSDEQKTSIKQLRMAMDKDVRKNENLLREKKAHLRTLQDEDKPDQKAIYKTIDEITALQGQTMKARADFRIKVSAQLNDEQRAAFQQQDEFDGKRFTMRSNRNMNFGNIKNQGRIIRLNGRAISDMDGINTNDIESLSVNKNDNGITEIDITTK